ncbi:L-histidine N(alpha)-methyltransferase [Litoribacter alkaliphilus]|uniref:L-histidine N(Alpha)-methyltransferase n=1 Tax=Litoribacter ruber TaxID=702568 RepID=A0AAP2CHZ4_9BACT|nr:L-histidine N(alpha)-methyltransferase [Litoribacter alkaliphilus]MBS9525061.1 L-histidine N(alpha)-methyltransferase [Litoribacter alkaliphilus]
MNHTTTYDQIFAQDVLQGLSSPLKTLPSKYFYDEKGDKLFQAIMALPEYYLTRTEYAILETYKAQILDRFAKSGKPFNLVELGAGNGLKTKILIQYLCDQKVEFTYFPIDISGYVLKELEEDLKEICPQVKVHPITGTYRHALKDREWDNGSPTLMLFLGSNYGNFLEEDAKELLDRISDSLRINDGLLMGFDLKKDPELILAAYNDAQGVTRDFNLNLLERINRELGGNFELDKFKHWPIYDPVSGECKSFLVSLEEQQVFIEALNKTFQFTHAEPIFTEVSKKYGLHDIDALSQEKGFKVEKNFMDDEAFFSDSLWVKS